jgi:septal ring factor EnvC (AmiA/AmiB activator)
VEDLELALDAAVHVNQHLNREIEAILQQLQRSEHERRAWQEQARRLAKQLARYKRAVGEARMGSTRIHLQLLLQAITALVTTPNLRGHGK